VQYLRYARFLRISRTAKHAAFFEIAQALILDFLQCHLSSFSKKGLPGGRGAGYEVISDQKNRQSNKIETDLLCSYCLHPFL
ncbi:MAG: hypothetical protein ACOC7W_08030, partial [Desulfosalsimonas sp.]